MATSANVDNSFFIIFFCIFCVMCDKDSANIFNSFHFKFFCVFCNLVAYALLYLCAKIVKKYGK